MAAFLIHAPALSLLPNANNSIFLKGERDIVYEREREEEVLVMLLSTDIWKAALIRLVFNLSSILNFQLQICTCDDTFTSASIKTGLFEPSQSMTFDFFIFR